jgi:hypothetical protein
MKSKERFDKSRKNWVIYSRVSRLFVAEFAGSTYFTGEINCLNQIRKFKTRQQCIAYINNNILSDYCSPIRFRELQVLLIMES